jgi:hypothetical protein
MGSLGLGEFLIIFGVFGVIGFIAGAIVLAAFKILRAPDVMIASPAPPQDGGVRSRLEALTTLQRDGLVSETEAAERRAEILDEL